MTTNYYVAYQIRRRDGRTAWLRSLNFETELEARELYYAKRDKQNVIDCELIKEDHYEPSELVRGDLYPDGVASYRVLAHYSRI